MRMGCDTVQPLPLQCYYGRILLQSREADFGFSAHLITNGVDTDIFKPLEGAPARKELGIDPDVFVIGLAGSIERWYAIDSIIRALPALTEYRKKQNFLLLGDRSSPITNRNLPS